MLFTATTIVCFYLLAAAFLVGGFATKNEALVLVGIALLIFGGYILFMHGISERVGEVAAVDGNETTTTFTYDQNQGIVSNGLGVVSWLAAFAFAFYLFDLAQERQRRRESGEIDE